MCRNKKCGYKALSGRASVWPFLCLTPGGYEAPSGHASVWTCLCLTPGRGLSPRGSDLLPHISPRPRFPLECLVQGGAGGRAPPAPVYLRVFASPSPLEGVSQDTGLPATVALFEPFGCVSRLHSASKVPRRNRSAIFLRIPSWGDTLPQFF